MGVMAAMGGIRFYPPKRCKRGEGGNFRWVKRCKIRGGGGGGGWGVMGDNEEIFKFYPQKIITPTKRCKIRG